MPGLELGVVEAPIDETSLLVIVGAAALAGLLVMLASPKLAIPVVVVELILGIIVGPQVAGLAEVDPTTEFLGNLGLGMLFFFAGYEIDFPRIKGRPMMLAGLGWGSPWRSPTGSAGSSPLPVWSSPTSTPAPRCRRPRSGR